MDFVPFDQATVVDPAAVVFADGGLLSADGTNLCATKPESIVFPNGTYPCFIGWEATPGARYPINSPSLVPFDQATMVDPNAVTIVPGGVITAEGIDLCAENPGSIVFPDGRYPCFINYVQRFGIFPGPQIEQVPVGGADTGVPASGGTDPATGRGVGVLGAGVLGAGAVVGLLARRRHRGQA
ncbi:hypothetical protein [Arthrobacter zhaoguopingii]|uniref:hypothetical protein n=1 Tax=Arthrobacter zhaoguopingii TaxID=2681491 RepID=UPI00135AAE81|nr:hypothetical protein [Arthrobacter zhaoguopingii]